MTQLPLRLLTPLKGGYLPRVTAAARGANDNHTIARESTPVDHWSRSELTALLAAGLVEPCGATEDLSVVSYRLTAAGRILAR